MDSESQFLAMKKFSWSPHRVSSVLAKTGFSRESPPPIRRVIFG